jgi:hypothetical protein
MKNGDQSRVETDSRLRDAALAVRKLYEPGEELTEWTSLDAEDFLEESYELGEN